MSAVLQSGEAQFEPMTGAFLPEVLRIELAAYEHPWAEVNFRDALAAGYQAQMLVADGTVLGYFIAMKGVDEVHLLNITVAPRYQGQGWARLMLEALAVVTTEPLAEAVARQILRDEHLHATFGWEMLSLLLPRLSADSRATLQTQLEDDFAGFEQSVCGELGIADMAGREIVIERGEPNLGVLTAEQYAMIFYSCLETEIFPQLHTLGFDPQTAWSARKRH